MRLQKQLAGQRERRRYRVRNRLRASQRPRLSVFRSNKHIYAQIIDDAAGRTLVSASTADADGNGGNKAAAEKTGQLLAERAKEKGITQVAFDRGAYRYHGRVAALADACRQHGLEF
jgi:large subunit ribosomal protein L18